jgi:hypothetical protein
MPHGEMGQAVLAVLVLFVIVLGIVAGVVAYHVVMYRARPLCKAPGIKITRAGKKDKISV